MLWSDFFKSPGRSRSKQLTKIAEIKRGRPKKKIRYCQIHLTSVWDEKFPRCAQGYLRNQFCKLGDK